MKLTPEMLEQIHTDVAAIVNDKNCGVQTAAKVASTSHRTATISIKLSITPNMDDSAQGGTYNIEGSNNFRTPKTKRRIVSVDNQLSFDIEAKDTKSAIEEEPELQVAVV